MDQLSGALEQLCHLAETDDVPHSTLQTVIESRESSIGLLEAPLENGQPRLCEKLILRRRMRSRGGEIALDFGPKKREAASW